MTEHWGIVVEAANPALVISGAVIIVLAGAVSLWLKHSYAGYGFLERMEKRERAFAWLPAGLAVVYSLVYSYLSVHRYHKLMLGAWDLGIFESLLANALRGEFFRDYRGAFDHFDPAVGLYLPFYALWRDARLLLVLQTAVLTLAVWPLYLLAKEVSGRAMCGAAAAVAYLLYPLVGGGNLYDFHATALSPLFFFTMLLFMQRRRWGWYWVFAGAVLCVKEGEAILVFGAGLYLVSKREYVRGAVTAAVAVVWVVVVTGFLMPWITGEEFRHFSRFMMDAGTQFPPAVRASRLFAVTLFAMLPMGFFVARRWRVFFLIFLPALLVNALTSSNFQAVLFGHYGLTVASAAGGALALGMERGKKDGKERESQASGRAHWDKSEDEGRGPSAAPVFLLMVAVLCNVVLSYPAHRRWERTAERLSMEESWNVLSMPIPATHTRLRFYRAEPHDELFLAIRKCVPRGSVVAAQNNLGYFFAEGYELKDLSADVEADYYLFDFKKNYDTSRETYTALLERLESDVETVPFFVLETTRGTDFVFYATGSKWIAFYDNVKKAHEADGANINYKVAITAIEKSMGLAASFPEIMKMLSPEEGDAAEAPAERAGEAQRAEGGDEIF